MAKAKAKSKAVLKSKRHGYKSQKNWKPLCSSAKLKKHKQEMAAKNAEAAKPPKVRIQPVKVLRRPDGKWLPGSSPNPSGAPVLGTNRLELLLTAVRKVESRKNKTLLEYFVSRAFDDDGVLIALIRKLHPDLAAIQLSTLEDNSMNDAMALEIQKKLRCRYNSRSDIPASEEAEKLSE